MFEWLKILMAPEPCAGCTARDYTIATLKEIIHQKDVYIDSMDGALTIHEQEKTDLIKHLTGQKRAIAEGKEPIKMTSVPRNTGIRARIAHAEQVTADPTMSAQRRAEYDKRIADLLRPETTIVEDADAVQEDRTEQVR